MPTQANVAIYARYSSDRQTEDSIEAQIRACTDYAHSRGLTVVGAYADEAISGKGSKTASRTQYQRLLRDCKKGLFSLILIHKYDRVARSIQEHVTLEMRLRSEGVELVAVAQDFGSSNEAKIMRTLMWALSEYYIDNLADEVRKGHKETAIKALHNGGYAPFGYDIANQAYVINELEAGYVRKMFDCAAKKIGFVQLIAEMEAQGIKGKRGKPIKYPQIYEILRNEKYAGTYIYSTKATKHHRQYDPGAIRIDSALPAIVPKELFKEVQQIMSERKQTGTKSDYLCSGLVYCECGAKMHGFKSSRKEYEYKYYACSKKCGAPFVPVQEVDTPALDYLRELLSPDNQQALAKSLREYQEGERGRVEEFNKAIKRELADKQKQYDGYMETLGTGGLPAEVIADIGRKMEALKGEMKALQEMEPPRDFTRNQIIAWFEAIKKAPDEKAIHLLIERIDVKNKTEISIKSTLSSVLGENGSGGRI